MTTRNFNPRTEKKERKPWKSVRNAGSLSRMYKYTSHDPFTTACMAFFPLSSVRFSVLSRVTNNA